jgi:exosortase D (VPLPA-CTERM-specific)
MTALGYVSVVDKRPVRMLIFLNVALVLAVIAFSDGIGELIVRWSKQEEYSHGFLIPIISAWLLWTRREALYASIERASWLGLPLIFVALAMGIVGDLSAVYLLSQVGVVIVLLGIALCVGGAPLLRLCFIPIAFLLFAIPLPYFVDAILTLKLQLISSELGVFFIRLFGIPVYLDGNIIDMGTYKLQVVEACSGLRYLYPLLSLSFLAAYLFHAPLWQRTIVLLSSIPIAIGMNGFRIALVGILVNGWGNQMAEGVLHAFEGWVIFLACAMLLTAEMYVLALVSGKRFMDLFYFPRTFSQAEDKLRSHSIQVYPLLFAVGLLCVGTAFAYFTSQRTEAAQQRTPFAGFPDRLGDWRGRLGSLDNSTEQYLKLDDYILSDYAASDDKSVNLYVAYYASQRGGESPHSPVACIPGSGWAITDIRTMVYNGLHPVPKTPS